MLLFIYLTLSMMEKALYKHLPSMDVLGIIVRMVRDMNYEDVINEVKKETSMLPDLVDSVLGYDSFRVDIGNCAIRFRVVHEDSRWRVNVHRWYVFEQDGCRCIDCIIAKMKGRSNPHRTLPLWVWEHYFRYGRRMLGDNYNTMYIS
jgi:hypothetical protein